MTEREMLEAEKYWCENCCNWDKEEVQMDACSTCKLTGTRVFAQESGKECKCFNVPAENVIVPPCKVGRTLYFLYDRPYADKPDLTPRIYETNEWYFDIDENGISILPRNIHGYKGKHHYYLGKTVFLTREEAKQALKGGVQE